MPERLAHQEVRLRIPELMVPVSGIRRIFRRTHEVVRGHERHVSLEFRPRRCRSLRLAEPVPLTGRLHPRAGDFAHYHRKLRCIQVLPHVVDQVHQVRFVLRHGVLRVASVVPSLVPDEPRQLVSIGLRLREALLDAAERRAYVRDHARVVRAHRASRGWRAEIHVQAFAAPCRLDEEHFAVERLADHVAELELRSKVVLVAVGRKPERERPRAQRAAFGLVPRPYVVAHAPRAVGRAQVRQVGRLRGVGHQRGKRSLGIVVVGAFQVHYRLAFHVGLASQDVDLHGRAAGGPGRPGQQGYERDEQGAGQARGSGCGGHGCLDRGWSGPKNDPRRLAGRCAGQG